jgi:ligand-binding SRPBCC domain-containing protein
MPTEAVLDRLAWAPCAAGDRPSRGVSVLHEETIVPASVDETFAFFSDAANLERLTPPWLSFRIRTPQPIAMAEGTEIEYRIVLYGLPIPWLTRIDVWEPGVRFVDRQLRGPYRWWHHEHRFEPVDGGTRVIDHVEFVPRARFVSGPMVRRDVRRIFDYRKGELSRLFTQFRDQGME